jgi:hypothetical protein
MSIKYTYEIIAVDEAARCMEIVYSAQGRQPMHVGARLPYEGESVEQVVSAYAPVAFWQEQDRAVQVPQVGLSGEIDPVAPAPAETIDEWRSRAVVSRFQARAALHEAGKLAEVEALMSADTTPVLARLAWQDAQEFRRNSPTVLSMGEALELSPEDLDALFRAAALIEA